MCGLLAGTSSTVSCWIIAPKVSSTLNEILFTILNTFISFCPTKQSIDALRLETRSSALLVWEMAVGLLEKANRRHSRLANIGVSRNANERRKCHKPPKPRVID